MNNWLNKTKKNKQIKKQTKILNFRTSNIQSTNQTNNHLK